MTAFASILTFARDDDAEGIRMLVARGCPPSFPNKMGQTALHIGGIWGSIQAVKALIELKADPNARNMMRGSAPLHAAAMGRGPVYKRAECAKLLVAARADPRMQDLSGETPIDAAGDEEIRLAMGAAPLHLHKAVEARDRKALCDCLAAVREGRCEVTLDTQNQLGDTALHVAVHTSWKEGVELLLEARAFADTSNHEGQTALHIAVIRGHHRNVQLLLEHKASAHRQDCDTDHDPRYRSASFEETPGEHRTPLHYASQLGNVVAMRLLLEQGSAEPNSRDSRQETPLHLCLLLREPGAQFDVGSGVRLHGLRNHPEWNGRYGSVIGPKLSMQGDEFHWPVLIDGQDSDAILLKEANLQLDPEEALDLLLAARADVDVGSHTHGESWTVLHEASRTGDIVLAGKCLEARADVNKQDKKLGLGPLHMAARGKHHDVARLLMRFKADANQASSGGKTAYELAHVNGCPKAFLPLYRGEEVESDEDISASGQAQTLQDLTPDQRALLFIE